MFKATTLIEKEFKKSGIKCSTHEISSFSFVEAGFTGENCTFKLRFISTDNDNDVKVLTEDLVKIPSNKLDSAYKVINSFNAKYKYAKFSVSSSNAVTAEYDFAVATPSEAVGPIAVETALRFAKIVDDGYPEIMRVVWG